MHLIKDITISGAISIVLTTAAAFAIVGGAMGLCAASLVIYYFMGY